MSKGDRQTRWALILALVVVPYLIGFVATLVALPEDTARVIATYVTFPLVIVWYHLVGGRLRAALTRWLSERYAAKVVEVHNRALDISSFQVVGDPPPLRARVVIVTLDVASLAATLGGFVGWCLVVALLWF